MRLFSVVEWHVMLSYSFLPLPCSADTLFDKMNWCGHPFLCRCKFTRGSKWRVTDRRWLIWTGSSDAAKVWSVCGRWSSSSSAPWRGWCPRYWPQLPENAGHSLRTTACFWCSVLGGWPSSHAPWSSTFGWRMKRLMKSGTEERWSKRKDVGTWNSAWRQVTLVS